jgi:zeaxanthin glucosyltransferase
VTHFAVISPPFLSHVRSFEAIAEVLAGRGHRVTLVAQPDAATLLRSPALGFHPVGAATHPPGSLAAVVARAARPGGPLGILRTVHDLARGTDMLCRELPAAVRAIGAEAIIADEMEAAGGLVAEHLGLPFVSVANAVSVRREPTVPSPVLPFDYDATPKGEKRNRGAEWVGNLLMGEHSRVIARHAAAFSLTPKRRLEECLSPFAELNQVVRGLDMPRRHAPPTLRAVGPLRPPLTEEPPLELPVDPTRPFVFASFGTLQGSRLGLFRKIAAACRALGYQLLVAHCGGLHPTEAQSIGATWVTDFAPQRAVLARADLLVTHAGVNTVLDALTFGVPMLAMPFAFDQPGVAARIVHAGVGMRLMPRFATVVGIKRCLDGLIRDPSYRHRAELLGQEIRTAGGAVLAAEIIEQVARTGRPVPAPAQAAA